MELALLEEKHRSEAKTAFLFNISHDIRTPMTAILGFSELARRHINEPELLSDYLEKTVSSSRQMLLIIDDMLEVNQLYSSHLELENKPSRLGEQIGRVLESLRSEAEHHHITLVEDLSLGEEQVLVDQTCFRRILGNLLSNAIKFTPQDGTVTVTARERVEGDRSHLTLTVADTGVGMSPDFMERMFDAFEQEESSTQSGLFGTGLGLTIVKGLLDQMGGSISAQSVKGEGSVFTVTLSLPRVLSLEDASSISTPSMEPGAQIQRRLLVVEDLEFNRILEETLLEESGFLVECAVHGLEAVEAVKSHPAGYYDLILMDIQMPVMNGYEATKAIRAMKDRGSLPIVALSANARDEDRLMSRNSGMDDHVAKPFEIDALVAVINEHIAAKNT
jgi:CheY-like chemotaxis protein